MKHTGGCHCGAVQFEFEAPEHVDVTICNCSVCDMSGYKHVFIPKGDVHFLAGKDTLKKYSFGTHQAQHLFCPTCGVKPLYVPRSHPDSYSVNLRCVTSKTLKITNTINFDGQNWEDNIKDLKSKT